MNFSISLELIYSLRILYIQPTRITYSATLIDNIFFNSTLIDDLSDHLPNFLIINEYTALSKNFKKSKRDYSKLNTDDLIDEFENIDWDAVFFGCDNDASKMFNAFYQKTSTIIDDHIPLKQLSKRALKQLSKPWITKGIINSIKMKNKLNKKFIKSRSAYNHEKYKQYRNLLNNVIKSSKKSYYHNFFEKNNSDIKNIWKGIRSLVSLKLFSGTVPSKLLLDDIEVTES